MTIYDSYAVSIFSVYLVFTYTIVAMTSVPSRTEVYMCVKFAKIQPAAKGNMVVHCGGKMIQISFC
jgi:hypothetical protein